MRNAFLVKGVLLAGVLLLSTSCRTSGQNTLELPPIETLLADVAPIHERLMPLDETFHENAWTMAARDYRDQPESLLVLFRIYSLSQDLAERVKKAHKEGLEVGSEFVHLDEGEHLRMLERCYLLALRAGNELTERLARIDRDGGIETEWGRIVLSSSE